VTGFCFHRRLRVCLFVKQTYFVTLCTLLSSVASGDASKMWKDPYYKFTVESTGEKKKIG